MKTTNHAPEPWTIRRLSKWHDGTPQEFDLLEVVSRQGYQLAITHDCKPKAVATANLIAAAPDLLSALREAYNAIAWDIPGGNLSDADSEALLDTIRAAIAKAEGVA